MRNARKGFAAVVVAVALLGMPSAFAKSVPDAGHTPGGTSSAVTQQTLQTAGGGATARCNDGTYSYAAHHQGACSTHGGVAEFYK